MMKERGNNLIKAFSMFLILTLLAANVSPVKVSAANSPFRVPTSAAELASTLVAPNSGIAIVEGTEEIKGSLSASSMFTDLNLGILNGNKFAFSSGILVTSGNGTPPTSNTSANYTTILNQPGNSQLESMVQVANTKDAFSLEFKFTVPDEMPAVEFQYMFGSEEFPEYIGSQYVDGAVVIVDGVNYAKFANNVPLKVVSDADMMANTGLSIEYDGVSPIKRINALLNKDLTVHTLKIIIADTGDYQYDSGLFLAFMKPSTSTVAGIIDLPASVNNVTVTPKTAAVAQGGTKQLKAETEISGGADQSVAWTSSDETEKVTVSSNGLVSVSPDAEPGDYIITAASVFDSTKKDSATITVPAPASVNGVTISPKTATVVQGGTKQMYSVVDTTGEADQSVYWLCSDEEGMVTIDDNGLVKVSPDAEPGDYTIIVSSNFDPTKYDMAVITVVEPAIESSVNSVTASPKTVTIAQGGSEQLTAAVSVTGSAIQTVNWESSDETGKVTVDGNGLVRVSSDAVAGDYTITVTSVADPTKYDTVTVTVPEPAITDRVESVTVSPKTANLSMGDSRQFQAVVNVIGNTTSTVNWTSSDEKGKVTVNGSGLVTVASDAAAGTYTIKAVSVADSTKYDTAAVNVTSPAVVVPEPGTVTGDNGNEKTIQVVEVPEGIKNPEKIRVIAGDDVFDKSVEVRLKGDASIEALIRQQINKLNIEDGAEVIIYPLDISIYEKGTNIKVQPKSGTSVDIVCPIPDSLLSYKDKLVIVSAADGKLEVLPAKLSVEDGVDCVTFTAKHFSPYGFVADLNGTLAKYAAGTDNTSDTGEDTQTDNQTEENTKGTDALNENNTEGKDNQGDLALGGKTEGNTNNSGNSAFGAGDDAAKIPRTGEADAVNVILVIFGISSIVYYAITKFYKRKRI